MGELYSGKELNDMSIEELNDALTDVINAREDYPEESTDPKAIKLDNAYWDITNLIGVLKRLTTNIRNYVMDDTVRKENFADVEICCEDDNYFANEMVNHILSEYTYNDCLAYLKEEGLDIKDFDVEEA